MFFSAQGGAAILSISFALLPEHSHTQGAFNWHNSS